MEIVRNCLNIFSRFIKRSTGNISSKKKKKPNLDAMVLLTCSNELFDILGFANSFQKLNPNSFVACQQLAESIRSYSDYLVNTKDRSSSNRDNKQETLRETITKPIESVDEKDLRKQYHILNKLISTKDYYEPIPIQGEFVPDDKRKRYNWFKDLANSTESILAKLKTVYLILLEI